MRHGLVSDYEPADETSTKVRAFTRSAGPVPLPNVSSHPQGDREGNNDEHHRDHDWRRASRTAAVQTKSVRANGIDIHYREAGSPPSPDLVLLHGALVSTNPLWDQTPLSYGTHLAALSERFHVIASDVRGYGLTRHDGGGRVSMSLLADDVAALIDALELDRPAVAGFSNGGMIATIAAIRHPGILRALVNDAGRDIFDPESKSFPMLRHVFGGSEDATEANPSTVEASFAADPSMRGVLALIKADHDSAGGPGHWQTMLRHFFEAAQHWPGYGFNDFASIDVPTLVLVGDRDEHSPVEDCIRAYRHLPHGQLCVLPNTGHVITTAKVAAIMNFLG
ncbi:alpha/beta hydrolase [Nocardioides speluncae]|uniref:alpha/beta fold hydrolase n=1 Tax=Nocardioides speluncae TaxID=2670337 RepID=UPI0030B80BFB